MKYFDLISKKINGELSPQDERAFDAELEVNPELAEEYNYQIIEESILLAGLEKDVFERVKVVGEDRGKELFQGNERAKTINLKRAMAIAASVLVLVTSLYFIRLYSQSFSSEELATTMYNDYSPNLSGLKSFDEEQGDWQQYILMLSSEEQQELSKAITFFQEMESENPVASYYLAHGYWLLDDYEKSLTSFSEYIEGSNSDSRFKSSAEFYKSLVLVALGKEKEAKEYILAMKDGHPFEKPWDQLLDRIP